MFGYIALKRKIDSWRVDLTEVIHPLELLSDRHSTGRLHRDYHPDCVAKEVPGRLEESGTISDKTQERPN